MYNLQCRDHICAVSACYAQAALSAQVPPPELLEDAPPSRSHSLPLSAQLDAGADIPMPDLEADLALHALPEVEMDLSAAKDQPDPVIEAEHKAADFAQTPAAVDGQASKCVAHWGPALLLLHICPGNAPSKQHCPNDWRSPRISYTCQPIPVLQRSDLSGIAKRT